LFIGISYTTITYFMQLAFPDVSVFTAPDAAAMEIADIIGGAFFTAVFLGIIITAILVGGVAAQMGSSRLLYAMGRDNVFPRKIFGHLHPKTGIPVYNILITGAFGLVAIFLTLDVAASIISFGAFTAFTFVNLSLIVHTVRHKNYGSVGKVIMNLIFPAIGTAFLGLMWYNIDPTALKLGIIWNIGGFIFLLFLTRFFRRQAPSLATDEAH
jgi:putrescine importer